MIWRMFDSGKISKSVVRDRVQSLKDMIEYSKELSSDDSSNYYQELSELCNLANQFCNRFIEQLIAGTVVLARKCKSSIETDNIEVGRGAQKIEEVLFGL